MKRLAGRRQPDAATTLPERSRLPARSTVAFGIPFILTLYAQPVLGYSAVEFGLSSLPLPSEQSSARCLDSRSCSERASDRSPPRGWR
jgi:hypothetical protein